MAAVSPRRYRLAAMLTDNAAFRDAFQLRLVLAGWVLAVALPVVGLVLGVVTARRPEPVRTHGLVIIAISLMGIVMWCLILAGAPASPCRLGGKSPIFAAVGSAAPLGVGTSGVVRDRFVVIRPRSFRRRRGVRPCAIAC